jgi:hypothetical protein
MGEVCIKTDKEKEAIYLYTDTNTALDPKETNLAKDPGKYDIRLHYTGGNRKIEISEAGKPDTKITYALRDPKKPDDTPAIVRFNGADYTVVRVPELEKQFSTPVLVIEKKQ